MMPLVQPATYRRHCAKHDAAAGGSGTHATAAPHGVCAADFASSGMQTVAGCSSCDLSCADRRRKSSSGGNVQVGTLSRQIIEMSKSNQALLTLQV